MSEIPCTTRVRVTIEVRGYGNYSADWTLEDLVKQSSRETLQMLTSVLHANDLEIIGEPEVIASIFRDTP